MGRRVVGLFGILVALALEASIQNIPVDCWVYDDFDLLKTSGLIRSMPSTSRPWTRGEAARLLVEADSLARQGSPGLRQRAALQRLRSEFTAEAGREPDGANPRRPAVSLAVPGVEGGYGDLDLFSRSRLGRRRQTLSIGTVLSNRPADQFALYERIELTGFHPDTHRVHDSAGPHLYGYRVCPWQEKVTVEMEHAYLAFKVPWLRLGLGRDEFVWGPGYLSSVMLSDNAPSLDQVQWCASYRSLKYLAFSSYLSRWGLKHRFLSGQRLEVSLGSLTTLGGAMFNIYSPDSFQTTDLAGMMNPLLPLYLQVANTSHGDNLLVGWDAVFYLPGVKVYGQLFVDNYEFKPKEVMPPNAVGWQAGAYWTPVLPVEVRFEYARIAPFTYYHRVQYLMYENWSIPLGHELGPDADRLFGCLGYAPRAGLELRLAASHTRRGFHNRGDFRRKTWYDGDSLPRSFPAEGVNEAGEFESVERTLRLDPEVEWWVLRDLRLLATGGFWSAADYLGRPNDSRHGVDFSVQIEYRY